MSEKVFLHCCNQYHSIMQYLIYQESLLQSSYFLLHSTTVKTIKMSRKTTLEALATHTITTLQIKFQRLSSEHRDMPRNKSVRWSITDHMLKCSDTTVDKGQSIAISSWTHSRLQILFDKYLHFAYANNFCWSIVQPPGIPVIEMQFVNMSIVTKWCTEIFDRRLIYAIVNVKSTLGRSPKVCWLLQFIKPKNGQEVLKAGLLLFMGLYLLKKKIEHHHTSKIIKHFHLIEDNGLQDNPRLNFSEWTWAYHKTYKSNCIPDYKEIFVICKSLGQRMISGSDSLTFLFVSFFVVVQAIYVHMRFPTCRPSINFQHDDQVSNFLMLHLNYFPIYVSIDNTLFITVVRNCIILLFDLRTMCLSKQGMKMTPCST